MGRAAERGEGYGMTASLSADGTLPIVSAMARSDNLLRDLRGTVGDRPPINGEFIAALRSEVEEAANALGRQAPIQVSKEKLSQVHQCEGRYAHDRRDPPNLAMVRGMLAHRAIQRSIDGSSSRSPQRLAEQVVERCIKSDKPVGELLRSLGAEDRCQLVDELVDYQVSYLSMFPALPTGWAQSEVETSARVGDKVVLRGRIDMKLGRKSKVASTVLIDFKTGQPSATDRDDLRFYSLIETLGTGGQPYRFANVYLQSSTYQAEDVTEAMLWSTARRATDGLSKMHELSAGRPPHLSPGPVCRFCPARPTCAEASNNDDWHGERGELSASD